MARLWAGPWARLQARLRVLLSLLMVTSGAILAGLAISGYYEAHRPPGQASIAPAGTREPEAKSQLPLLHARQRFLAIDDAPPAPPAKPRVVAKALPATTKPAVKAQPAVKDKRPQQAAGPWPWSLFSN